MVPAVFAFFPSRPLSSYGLDPVPGSTAKTFLVKIQQSINNVLL